MVAALRKLDCACKERIPSSHFCSSGYAKNAIVHGGRLDSGLNLLAKPYSRQMLSMRVRKLLDQRQPALS